MTKPKKLVIYDVRGIQEYVIKISTEESKKVFSLFASDNKTWTDKARRTLLMKISVEGDFIKLDKKYKKLNFAKAHYLRILMNLERHLSKASLPVIVTDVEKKKSIII